MKVISIIISSLLLGSFRPNINYSVEIYLFNGSTVISTDTVRQEFSITKEDLPTMPFINDEGIELFDTTSYQLTFSKEAIAEIRKLKPSLQIGIPFVLTVDREPILTGYFVNMLSSFGCGAYVLNTTERFQRLMKGLPETEYAGRIPENRKNFLLIQALMRTGRLK